MPATSCKTSQNWPWSDPATHLFHAHGAAALTRQLLASNVVSNQSSEIKTLELLSVMNSFPSTLILRASILAHQTAIFTMSGILTILAQGRLSHKTDPEHNPGQAGSTNLPRCPVSRPSVRGNHSFRPIRSAKKALVQKGDPGKSNRLDGPVHLLYLEKTGDYHRRTLFRFFRKTERGGRRGYRNRPAFRFYRQPENRQARKSIHA
jgi:hypothetical protein